MPPTEQPTGFRRVIGTAARAALLAAAAVLLASYGDRWGLAARVVAWCGLLVGTVLLLRKGWARLLGPMFFYDLVRTGRRNQHFLYRGLYAVLLVLILVLACWLRGYGVTQLMSGVAFQVGPQQEGGLNELAQFGRYVFSTLMVLQFAVVFLFTPLYTAGAIAEEKERRTIDLLLTTHLTDREIVLGMLGARLGNMALLLLTGLPFVSLLEFLGGVSPEGVLQAYLATAMMMLSLGGISIVVSVNSRTSLSAVVWAYVISGLLLPLYIPFLAAVLEGDVTVGTVTVVVCLLIHGLISFFCIGGAVTVLRTMALGRVEVPMPPDPRPVAARRQPDPQPAAARAAVAPAAEPADVLVLTEADLAEPPPPPVRPRLMLDPPPETLTWRRRHPPVGGDGLFWKEVYAEPYLGPADPRDLLACLPWLVVTGLVVALLALLAGADIGPFANGCVRGVGVALACLLLIVVAVSAAQRVTRERERQTLDGLLTLPVTDDAILFAKWLGSILSARWPAWGLALLLAFGLVTGGLSPAAVAFLVAAGAVAVAFVAMLGLRLSAGSKTSLRATLLAVLLALLVIVGPGYVLRAALADPTLRGDTDDLAGWVTLVADYGLTLPATLWLLAFGPGELTEVHSSDPANVAQLFHWARITAAVAGLHIYLLATGLLWLATRARFGADRGPRPKRGMRDEG